MWEPQPLTTLRASKACRGENFTFTLFNDSCIGSDEVALGQVFSEYFGFPWQFSFHRLFHTHPLWSGAGAVGQLVAGVLSGPSLTQTQETRKNVYIGITPRRRRQKLLVAQHHTNKTKLQ
jgi:hypothetical protein